MGYELVVLPNAQIEIETAVFWYESRQVGLGLDFLNYLDGYFATLKVGTVFFTIKHQPHFRELPLKRFPFIVIYEVFDTSILIHSVFNTMQNPSKKPK